MSMRVFSSLMSLSNENKNCMQVMTVDKYVKVEREQELQES